MTSDPSTQKHLMRIQQLRSAYLLDIQQAVLAVCDLAEGYTDPAGQQIKVDIHKHLQNIASTAGAFGLTELSARARLLEQTLQGVDASNQRNFLNSVRKMYGVIESINAASMSSTERDEVNLADVDILEANALKIMVVDEDVHYTHLLNAVLKMDFQVFMIHSSEAALACYRENDPDIVLLDVNINDMSGHELCAQFEKIRPKSWRSLVFLSAHNRVDDTLKAFDAGAEDYIVRPILLEDLYTKLKVVATYTKSRKDLLTQNQQTRKLAYDSMVEVAQYGRMVDFMRQAMSCKTNDTLMKIFFETMEGFNLKCCLRLPDPYRCFGSATQLASPIESNLMETLMHSGRLNHLGKRTLVNGMYTGFLVKNMPVDDEIAYGRIKDMIAVMIEALDACFVNIARQEMLGLSIQGLGKVADRVASVVLEQNSPVQVMVKRLEHLMRQLESSFDFMDLNEQQEEFIFGLLHQGAMDATLVAEQLGGLREELNQINDTLMKYQQ